MSQSMAQRDNDMEIMKKKLKHMENRMKIWVTDFHKEKRIEEE